MKELAVLGLTKGEIKVYNSILNLGRPSVNQIHEKTGVERRGIYDIINKLIGKGLISYTVENGKKTYLVAPSKLKELLRAKKEEVKSFEKILPQIDRIYNSSKPDVGFEIFRGKEGVKTVFEDMLNYKKVYAIAGGFYITQELPYYWPQYNKRRIKTKCVWRNLIRHDFGVLPKDELVKAKVLPKEFSGNPVVIIIYGNKVVNLSWGEEWFAFVIENEDVAQNYKQYHKYLWENVATTS
ncbi:hypothetical protein H8D36_04735 [archaeon]|nr:hypothetical protein [archaeon]MBL7057684.1 hypothetical protein [Candidatus Woesearchaeota archaeon]